MKLKTLAALMAALFFAAEIRLYTVFAL